MGCIYAGFDYKNRVNGYFKIGETANKTPAQRLQTIRQNDCFQCLKWLQMFDDTRSERLFVESFVRMKMSRLEGLEHTQNDHFLYRIISKEEKYSQAQEFAEKAIEFAIQACEMAGIKYQIGKRVYKRG